MAAQFPFNVINGRAIGYWGSTSSGGTGIRCRIASELIADKVLGLNWQKIMAMGLPMALWREASSVQTGLTTCSCFKNTAKQPDIPCLTCYGTGSIPGYFKFGTRNYWMSAVDPGWILSNIVLDTNNRPFRFQLVPGTTTGVAETPNMVISTTGKLGDWESKVDGFTRDNNVNSSILVEVSGDNGATWYNISNIIISNPTIQIKFRVTLSRTSTSVKSPMFEIVRARFATITDVRGEINEPIIRVLPTWLTEAEIRQAHGLKMEATGNMIWTLPLTLFDTSISITSRQAMIRDDAFVEDRYGGESGYRYGVTQFSYSENFGKFTRQQFALRKFSGEPGGLDGEYAHRVF